jgi:hypothetical protein
MTHKCDFEEGIIRSIESMAVFVEMGQTSPGLPKHRKESNILIRWTTSKYHYNYMVML